MKYKEVVQKKVWVTILTCKQCGKQEQIWHHGEGKPTEDSYPTSGEWNGWNLKKDLCFSCNRQIANSEEVKRMKSILGF